MIVGMTYDLRDDYLAEGFSFEQAAEFDRRETIDGIRETLEDLGYETDPIGHVRRLTGRIAAGGSWDLVFNIAEGVKGFAREAQVPALLEAHGIPYTFSDPMVLALTLHKGMTKRVIRDMDLATPDFRIVEDLEDLISVDLFYPVFAKPIAEGTGKGISARSKIKNEGELREVCFSMLREYGQPVLLETYLPGREFTVGILGNGKKPRSLGVLEVVLQGHAEPAAYSYHNKKEYETLVAYRLVEDREALKAADVALASWKALGCRDGGRVDLRSDSGGMPCFMEVNPLAGLHPVHSDLCILATATGLSYRDLIGGIIEAAAARYR